MKIGASCETLDQPRGSYPSRKAGACQDRTRKIKAENASSVQNLAAFMSCIDSERSLGQDTRMPTTYIRKPPPVAVQYGMGLFRCILKPTIWGLERVGLTSRVMQAMAARSPQRLAKQNPFR